MGATGMKTHRHRKQLCWTCGYAFEYASGVRGRAAPKNHDASICLNCGALFVWWDDRWAPATTRDIERLTPRQRALIELARRVRDQVVNVNLADKQGGRT